MAYLDPKSSSLKPKVSYLFTIYIGYIFSKLNKLWPQKT